MKKEFTVENVVIRVVDMEPENKEERKYFVTRDLVNGASLTEGVVSYVKSFIAEDGREFYGYSYEGYNFMTKKEFLYEDILQKEELQLRVRKWNIVI